MSWQEQVQNLHKPPVNEPTWPTFLLGLTVGLVGWCLAYGIFQWGRYYERHEHENHPTAEERP